MKTYLVGGAVRDKLLQEAVSERDWVVVGATPEELLKQGYKPVGRDFPVFLHPDTKEEYALARTERKTSSGHRGFVCDANPNVTLEEDLARRDLTINAIAEDEHGKLIDPYGGAQDIERKLLKHVSQAFVEDPLRVLRVARFAARFKKLGFQVAKETRLLMQSMTDSGELQSLTPERVWQEWYKSLQTDSPAEFIRVLHDVGALTVIFPELNGSALEQSLLSLKVVAGHSLDASTRLAAFMRHLASKDRIEALCMRLKVPKKFMQRAVLAHALGGIIQTLEMKDAEAVVTAIEKVDAFRKPERFQALLCACEVSTIASHLWQTVLEAASSVDASELVQRGLKGASMKTALHQARVSAVQDCL